MRERERNGIQTSKQKCSRNKNDNYEQKKTIKQIYIEISNNNSESKKKL